MADLKVRWRGVVYEIATCLTPARAALAASQWPGGIVEIGQMFAPGRKEAFSKAQRRALARMVLVGLGEPGLSLIGLQARKPKPGDGGALPSARAKVLAVNAIDHAFLTALERKPGRRAPLSQRMRELGASSSSVTTGGVS